MLVFIAILRPCRSRTLRSAHTLRSHSPSRLCMQGLSDFARTAARWVLLLLGRLLCGRHCHQNIGRQTRMALLEPIAHPSPRTPKVRPENCADRSQRLGSRHLRGGARKCRGHERQHPAPLPSLTAARVRARTLARRNQLRRACQHTRHAFPTHASRKQAAQHWQHHPHSRSTPSAGLHQIVACEASGLTNSSVFLSPGRVQQLRASAAI